jgi:hypothetical protein
MPPPESVMIVGGGLFPRTALVLQKLLPKTNMLIVDAVPAHIECAKQWLNGSADYKLAFYSLACAHKMADRANLIVFPLSFNGRRELIYSNPPADATVVHDWLWRPRGTTTVVSWLMLKRLNLVCR